MLDLQNRRMFLKAAMAAGAAWATADVLQVEEALAFAHEQTAASPPATLTVLSRVQGEVMVAMIDKILPAVDGRPGAMDCGALYFIDRALGTFNAAQKPAYLAGIADLNKRAAETPRGATTFASLDPAAQIEILKSIEQTPFFQMVRFDTMVGTFALPKWGGNRDYQGWHMIGFDHQPRFQPPFGYYDDTNGRA